MSNPVVLVFAGPNGSGKSTLTRFLPQRGVYINADDLKREYALTDLEAAEKAETLRNKLLEKKADFTFETVLSTGRNLRLLQKAKESGYTVQCVYVLTCNADINVARVKGRVREGGHDVPEDKIRSRYSKALLLLPQLIAVCDTILIYDNSIMPVLVYKKDTVGKDYFPTELWSIEKLKTLLNRGNAYGVSYQI
jgi:predicted ABC-type ATPase